MAKNASLYVRKAVVAALKAGADVAAIVSDRVYGPNPPPSPEWPFVKYGVPVTTPRLATGMDGSLTSFTVHSFARGEDETEASNLGAAVEACLDGRTMVLGTAFPARLQDIRWTGSQVIRDSEEATGWHSISNFEAKVTS